MPDTQPKEMDNVQLGESTKLRPIVGIGASAGGLEALETFFDHVPSDVKMAFVLVQHLSPSRASAMPELLARHSRLPVRHAEDGMPVELGRLYLIPPNASLTIRAGILRLAPLVEPTTTLIDHFFTSLARDQGQNAIGIILSGAGTDGTLGLKAIKEHGGLTMAQTMESAAYDSMPRSAISLGAVDYILPVEQMPAKLDEYAERFPMVCLDQDAEHAEAVDVIAGVHEICAILRQRTGHDFSRYKHATLLRRIQRRMTISHAESLDDYVERLRVHDAEADQLFADFLIGVTEFFRDSDAFSALAAQVVPVLLGIIKGGGPPEIRVWVAGCASGEEAYSVAIFFREAMAQLDSPSPSVKIFATDIDERALDIARRGRYPEGITEHITPKRLRRFFTKHGGIYQIDNQIRDMCVFARHNILHDPPFSRMDLIVCRNMLIYLQTDVQKNLARIFHYALRSGGFLFLGPSEGLTASPDLFAVIDKKQRIFRRNDVALSRAVVYPIVEVGRIAKPTAPLAVTPAQRPPDITKTIERVLIETYAPASVVINERGSILYIFGRTGKYLELVRGATSLNVIDMARKGLRAALTTAVHAAVKTRTEVRYPNVLMEVNGHSQRINLFVRPLSDLDLAADLFLVIFQDNDLPTSKEEAESIVVQPEQPRTEVLENELRAVKEHLQTTIEDFETSNQEFRSANEELQSTNEELQSTNHELQVSKEELQSINEEFQTVNAELSRKIEALDHANSDLQNFFENTNIATIFLDTELHVKKFSPAAAELFRFIPNDVGRPITDLVPTFTDVDLIASIRKVIKTLIPCEREIYKEDSDQWYMKRIRPYRSLDNAIGGVVITFVDITDLKRAQQQAANLFHQVELERTRLKMLVDHVPYGIALTEAPSGRMILANPQAKQVLMHMPVYADRTSVNDPSGLFATDGTPVAFENCPISRSLRGEFVPGEDYLYRPGGERMEWLRTSAGPIVADGAIVGTVITFVNIDKEKRAEQALMEVDRRKDEFLAILGHELRNPLAPVRVAAHMLRKQKQLRPEAEKYIEMIDRQVSHIVRLVDDLLDVSRIDRNKIQLRNEVVELGGLVRLVVDDHASRINAKGLQMDLKVPPQSVHVFGDKVRLTQIVANLLHNAIKFTDPPGRIDVEVEVSGQPPCDSVSIHVRDTGVGMTHDELEHIFTPFSQGEGGERSTDGLGLGLAVVKGLVELHGGTVSAESPGSGQGSHFTVRLPISALGAAPQGAVVLEPEAEVRHHRVLVIEDCLDISESISDLLKSEGHEVAVAATGFEGLEKARTFGPDIVLCDIGLPKGMDGYAVARALRDDPELSKVYLVAVTGYGQEEDKRRALAAGFDCHVTKPLNAELLASLVANYTARATG